MTDILSDVKQHLPKYRQRRVSYCGAPMPTMIRADGTEINGARYRCGDRFCSSCARSRSQRVYACILSAVKNNSLGNVPADLQRGWMVTLTHQKPPGLSGKNLRDARKIQSNIQRECHRRLKRHDYACQRIARHTASGNSHKIKEWGKVARDQLPIFDHTQCYKTAAPPLRDPFTGYQEASGGETTYIWAREITQGGTTRYEGWHVHSHYLVPTQSDAHRLISAYLAACKSMGIKAIEREQKISNPESPENSDRDRDERDAARYITQYVTKSGIEKMSMDLLEAYIYGIHGMRQYDAAGRWRPLGIGKKIDDSRPKVIAVREVKIAISSDGEMVERAIESDFSDFMRQRTTWWSAKQANAAKRRLDQYKTKSTDDELVENMKILAVNRIFSGENLWKDGIFVRLEI